MCHQRGRSNTELNIFNYLGGGAVLAGFPERFSAWLASADLLSLEAATNGRAMICVAGSANASHYSDRI